MDRYVADPHWGDWIICYFFLGGIAAGAYALAALVDLFGDESDRRATRAADYLAFPLVCVCGLLLIVDLGRPERFWHMLIQSETFRPMFKWWSPMSAGSWGLSAFGAFSLVSFLGVLVEDGWLGRRPLGRVARRGGTGAAIGKAVRRWVALASAFFLGSYTGVLLDGDEPAGLGRLDLARRPVPGLGRVDRPGGDGPCSSAGGSPTSPPSRAGAPGAGRRAGRSCWKRPCWRPSPPPWAVSAPAFLRWPGMLIPAVRGAGRPRWPPWSLKRFGGHRGAWAAAVARPARRLRPAGGGRRDAGAAPALAQLSCDDDDSSIPRLRIVGVILLFSLRLQEPRGRPAARRRARRRRRELRAGRIHVPSKIDGTNRPIDARPTTSARIARGDLALLLLAWARPAPAAGPRPAGRPRRRGAPPARSSTASRRSTPSPRGSTTALAGIIAAIGEPTGPTRGRLHLHPPGLGFVPALPRRLGLPARRGDRGGRTSRGPSEGRRCPLNGGDGGRTPRPNWRRPWPTSTDSAATAPNCTPPRSPSRRSSAQTSIPPRPCTPRRSTSPAPPGSRRGRRAILSPRPPSARRRRACGEGPRDLQGPARRPGSLATPPAGATARPSSPGRMPPWRGTRRSSMPRPRPSASTLRGRRRSCGWRCSRPWPRPRRRSPRHRPEGAWRRGDCPNCGEPPLLAESRGLEQRRFLRCGLCAADWPADRLRCPSCGESDPRALRTLDVEGQEGKARLVRCGSCGSGLKVASTFAPFTAPGLLVADLATIHLDFLP